MRHYWLAVTLMATWVSAGNALCPSPLPPRHGYVSDVSDSYVKYHCKHGYLLRGNEENYCLATDWAFELPICDVTYCPELELSDGVEISTQSLVHGTKVRFSCAGLETLDGAAETECSAGEWTNIPPQCILESCELDLANRHLEVIMGNFKVGSILEVQCRDSKHVFTGKSLLVCYPGRDWQVPDSELPRCIGCENVVGYADTAAILARGDFCYSFINTKYSYSDAKGLCERDNGYLVNVPDEETNEWLTRSLANDMKSDIWLGLKYVRSLSKPLGEWWWINDEGKVKLSESSFNNRKSPLWYLGQCQYMSMADGHEGTWWDKRCSKGKFKVVCQYPAQQER